LSNALEAIMGAVFLDGGYMVAKKIILKIFNSRIKNLNLDSEHKDHKSILQERLQEINKELPVYSLIRKDGKQHEQIFFVECLIKSEGIATQATGNSIRLAEQKAASKALKLMKNG
jgi:ribonuclease-3